MASVAAPAGPELPPWMVLADVLLRRAALVQRAVFGHRPDPLAGLKVDDEDLARLLVELPGLGETDMSLLAQIEGEVHGEVERARLALFAEISADDEFSSIVRFAQLSQPEIEVFALACAIEIDPRRQRVVGYLNDDVGQRRATLFTLQLLLPEPTTAALAVGPGSGLRRAALVLPPEPGPVGSAPVVPAASVVWRLAGDTSADPDLPPGWSALPGTAPAGPASTTSHPPPVLLVPGGDKVRRAQVASRLCGPLLRSPLPMAPPAWDALVRQASLDRCAVMLDLEGPLPPDARERIETARHLTWALASSDELPLDTLPRARWEEAPAGRAQATAADWSRALAALDEEGTDSPGTDGDGNESTEARAEAYSYSHNITAEQLELVLGAAPGTGGLGPALRRLAAGHISALAPRIRPSRTWDDLVLDPDRTERLREVVSRCRYKHTVFGAWGFQPAPSSGVVALFSGPSGTGKTLAAEIIAGELGMDLYKVDLSALVSKWVGETEKNLSAVFAAAEASNVALFFDEADAIFGKRSEVSDAHDRYANIEVAYLLQRLERYEGVVVMATNLATNIDPAFLRRIHVSVDFPMPEEAERERIWARSLPPEAPSSGLDLALLAKLFKFSGGSIRNAALTAGFIAADLGAPLTMECVVEAVQREMRKMGRLLTPADFGPFASLVKGATILG